MFFVCDSVKVTLPPLIPLESFKDPVLTVIQAKEWTLVNTETGLRSCTGYAMKPDKLFMNVIPVPNFMKHPS